MKNKKYLSKMIWRSVALLFVVIFCFVMVLGLIKLHQFKSQFVKTTPEQMAVAKQIVADDLTRHNDSIQGYQVHISDRTMRLDKETPSRTILQISLDNPSTRQLYLIDLDSRQIVMHSETMFYGWMQNSSKEPEHNFPERR